MKRLYIIILMLIGLSSINAQTILRGKTLESKQSGLTVKLIIDNNNNATFLMTADLGRGNTAKAILKGKDYSTSQFFYQELDLNSVELQEISSSGFVLTKDYAIINGKKTDKATINKQRGNGAWEKNMLPILKQMEGELKRLMNSGMLNAFKNQISYIDEKEIHVASKITSNGYSISKWTFVK